MIADLSEDDSDGDEEDKSTIFVSNLPHRVKYADVEHHMSQYGEIETLDLVMDPRTRQCRGFAFIKYIHQAKVAELAL